MAPDDLRDVLKLQVSPQVAENIMTAAERLRQEGRAEGRAELIIRLLQHRFGELDRAVEARVFAAPAAELDQYAERLLSAQSLADVFGD